MHCGFELLNTENQCATEATRKFTFEELQQLEDDYNFDWQCHEDTLQLLQKNGNAVATRNKKNLVRLGWQPLTMPQAHLFCD